MPVNGFLAPSPEEKFAGRPEFELDSLHKTAMIGTAAEIIPRIKYYQELGVDEFSFWCDNSLPHAEKKSLWRCLSSRSCQRFVDRCNDTAACLFTEQALFSRPRLAGGPRGVQPNSRRNTVCRYCADLKPHCCATSAIARAWFSRPLAAAASLKRRISSCTLHPRVLRKCDSRDERDTPTYAATWAVLMPWQAYWRMNSSACITYGLPNG